jgi:hypothetical protein
VWVPWSCFGILTLGRVKWWTQLTLVQSVATTKETPLKHRCRYHYTLHLGRMLSSCLAIFLCKGLCSPEQYLRYKVILVLRLWICKDLETSLSHIHWTAICLILHKQNLSRANGVLPQNSWQVERYPLGQCSVSWIDGQLTARTSTVVV